MWKKIKEILCKHTAYKDESTITSGAATTAASVIDLRLSPIITSQRTEMVHHHHQQPCRKLGSHTLNKTNEHCRSLFSLLPTSLRSHHRQTSNKKGIDASTTTRPSPIIDIIASDYESDCMSQAILNRTSSYASCYSSIPTNMPIPTINRYGSIENLLQSHSKSNPANICVIIQQNFEPFAQAHIAVVKGTIVTALFLRGPWLYIRIDSTGKTGYIPRMICALYKKQSFTNNLSISSIDSSLIKDNQVNVTTMSLKPDKYCNYPYKKQVINQYLSHSSAIIDDTKQQLSTIYFDERERRNTYTLPISPRTNLSLSKDRRLTLSSINCPLLTNKQELINIPTITRDTDSSSTQDSGYSESTSFFLVQQATPENEQLSLQSLINTPKKSNVIPHYATVRRSSLLKVPDPINPSQTHQKQLNTIENYRHTLLNGRSMNDMIIDESTKRHSLGIFDENFNAKLSPNKSIRRLPEFALIRSVRREQFQSQQKIKPSIYNLPKSHIQIPASIFLNHHRQKQQFGSSHSAFRPVQPTTKHKRASSEGHSPSISTSSSSSSLSSTHSPMNQLNSHRRHLSIDLPISTLSQLKSNSLTRSVCDQSSSSPIKLNHFSRTMSDILCDQFSEINIDAIEKDSLIHHHQPNKTPKSQQCLFTILKDYRSSRGSFTVKRGDCVYVLKQVGRACYLVRKQHNGQIGFIPKVLLAPTTSTRVDTFLKMHEYRETII